MEMLNETRVMKKRLSISLDKGKPMKSYYYLPVVGNMLALWSDFKPEENGSIDSQDNEERKNKLNKTRRRVVSPSETKK